jgi:hypothetical protein
MKEKDSRKGKVITLTGEQKDRIPRVFDTIYRIILTAVTDGEDVDRDETARLHTLRTIEVEGVVVVDGGKAVSINGEFEIPTEPKPSDEENLLETVFVRKEEAINAWRYLTKLQLDKFEKEQEKINKTVTALRTSLEEEQY